MSKYSDKGVFRTEENPDEICGKPAAWLISLPDWPKMPLCDEHIIRYQADKSERGPTRVGRIRRDGQYMIEPYSATAEKDCEG